MRFCGKAHGAQDRSRSGGTSVLTLEQLEARLAALVKRTRAAEEREARRARLGEPGAAEPPPEA